MLLKATSASYCIAIALLIPVLLVNAQTPSSENLDTDKTEPNTVFTVGPDVSAPRPIYSPDPEYSEEARKADYQGTCVLSLVVGPDGNPRNIKVSQSLGMGLDGKAVEAVRYWKFEAARKGGSPVAVQINVEVTFLLYGSRNLKEMWAETGVPMPFYPPFSTTIKSALPRLRPIARRRRVPTSRSSI